MSSRTFRGLCPDGGPKESIDEKGNHVRISRCQLWVTCLVIGVAGPTASAVGSNPAMANGVAGLSTAVQISMVTSDALIVRFTARNTSTSTIDVLSRDLPQARQSGAVLAVTRNGVPVPYRGRTIKYPSPTAADYVPIPAGGTYAVTLNLADDHDLSRAGTYTVAVASTHVRVTRGAIPALPDTVRIDAARATIHTDFGIRGSVKPSGTGIASTTVERPKTAANAVTITYRGCSSSQKTALQQAVSDAAQYSAKAETWLASNTSGAGAYATWFGSYNSSRFNHVTSTYSHISKELTTKTLLLDCTSTEDYYAYVYPDDPYTIYLCAVYWQAPAKGTDSKAGTLIHESSHFTVNGGSDDHVYGQTAARQLAKSNPAYAVTNADNFEYFAEGL